MGADSLSYFSSLAFHHERNTRVLLTLEVGSDRQWPVLNYFWERTHVPLTLSCSSPQLPNKVAVDAQITCFDSWIDWAWWHVPWRNSCIWRGAILWSILDLLFGQEEDNGQFQVHPWGPWITDCNSELGKRGCKATPMIGVVLCFVSNSI